MAFEKPKSMTCDCDEKAFFIHNISTGEYQYSCARSTLEWDSKKKKWYNDENAKFKPCGYKYTYIPECNKNLTFVKIETKKKYYKKVDYSSKIAYIPQKVKFFKTNKKKLHYEEIEAECKTYFIPLFSQWEVYNSDKDLGDYCEFLIRFCNPRISYSDLQKHYSLIIEEEQVKVEILQKIIEELEKRKNNYNEKNKKCQEKFKIYNELLRSVSKKYITPPEPVKVTKEGRKLPRIRNKRTKLETPEEIKNVEKGPEHEQWIQARDEKDKAFDYFYETFDEFVDDFQFDNIKRRNSVDKFIFFIARSNDVIIKEFDEVINTVRGKMNIIKNKIKFCKKIKKDIYTQRQKSYKWVIEHITTKMENLNKIENPEEDITQKLKMLKVN